jgi:hypothetical protein
MQKANWERGKQAAETFQFSVVAPAGLAEARLSQFNLLLLCDPGDEILRQLGQTFGHAAGVFDDKVR